MFPVYGFGAKLRNNPNSSASHCFALNGNAFAPEVEGVDGVIEAYYKSLENVELYGPTNMAESLENITGFARYQEQEMSQYNQKYTICLILTDGTISDFEETAEQIIKGSNLPLSIIIVGVGNADFS